MQFVIKFSKKDLNRLISWLRAEWMLNERQREWGGGNDDADDNNNNGDKKWTQTDMCERKRTRCE